MAETTGFVDSELDRERKINETRERFKNEYLAEKYDPRDVEKLQKDDDLVHNYLQWRLFNVDDTLKMIDESFQWRKEYRVNDLTENDIPTWMFDTGAVYLHGYDKEGNKLFWFRVKMHVKDAKTASDKKRYVAFWLERYARREPGMPLTVVFDMTESGITNIDMDFVKYIISCFKVYYPKFLSKMIMYEMPWIMNAAWKIVKTWLGPEAISKLKFVSKNDIQEFIDREYLPPYMGGMDDFKYSYPPLPDDDFQTPLCENGPIVSEDDTESKDDAESECRDPLEMSQNEDQLQKTKKVNFLEENLKQAEEKGSGISKTKYVKKPMTTFKGQLLNISPAEELNFGSRDGERKCKIILYNVTKNVVAFKVRTTAPDKYRVKPSNSSCDPGASLDIVVSLHGGSQASPQDRFLVMAAEMDQNSGTSTSDLAQFWKDVPKVKVMEHRLRCHVVESNKPNSLLLNERTVENYAENNHEDINSKIFRLMASNKKFEAQIDQCLWFQKMLMGLVSLLMAITCSTLYLLYNEKRQI
ncbi:motile sperm domain-containing protein 2 [Polypterus senegalus]|uniref:motile sperm domain-containing protein 2 n=1 Tax=Polypterus senegalus TaxID=55291 RepID=UPI0019664EFF|nr:motile sperm domain-containing protein 2 [Polypterus senegalus]